MWIAEVACRIDHGVVDFIQQVFVILYPPDLVGFFSPGRSRKTEGQRMGVFIRNAYILHPALLGPSYETLDHLDFTGVYLARASYYAIDPGFHDTFCWLILIQLKRVMAVTIKICKSQWHLHQILQYFRSSDRLHVPSCPWSASRIKVPPMEITSSSGCGERLSPACAGSARSGLCVSSALGFPPGQPVMVCCSLLNTSILILCIAMLGVMIYLPCHSA